MVKFCVRKTLNNFLITTASHRSLSRHHKLVCTCCSTPYQQCTVIIKVFVRLILIDYHNNYQRYSVGNTPDNVKPLRSALLTQPCNTGTTFKINWFLLAFVFNFEVNDILFWLANTNVYESEKRTYVSEEKRGTPSLRFRILSQYT